MYDTIEKERPALQPLLKPLKKVVDDLYVELLALQDRKSGAWTKGGMATDAKTTVYNTVRALGAVHARELPNQPNHPALCAAHRFFIDIEGDESLYRDIKGCINAFEMLDDLFHLKLPFRDPHVLVSLSERLRKLSLDTVVMSRRGGGVQALRDVQGAVQRALERSGKMALAPLGVNAQLLDAVEEPVLKEFGEDDDVRPTLERFLSATMTETRGNAAHSLIRGMWGRPGFLNFVPFFERLTELEYSGSFFEDYRDHTNHQLLVFLLGAHVYYSNAMLRKEIDKEIVEKSKARGLPIENAEGEFLFRWKLAANFHDVGYIFEVSPRSSDAAADAARMKEQSLALINKYADDFLKSLVKSPDDLAKIAAETYPDLATADDLLRLRSVSVKPESFARLTSFLPEEWRWTSVKGPGSGPPVLRDVQGERCGRRRKAIAIPRSRRDERPHPSSSDRYPAALPGATVRSPRRGRTAR
jgi:hypothetical protein